MQYKNKLSDYQDSRRSAVTFGKFDGLHRGHQMLVKKVQELGRVHGINSIVCAFDMRPLWVRKGVHPAMLMTSAERMRHLEQEVDYLVECPFTEEFGGMEAEAFIRDIICGLFHAKYVAVGTDFQFGHGKRGDIHMLRAYADTYDYQVIVIEKERYQDRVISSTYIKEVLKEGRMELASNLLGYAYGISGTVAHGKQLGRRLGFPTLNVAWHEEKAVPPHGVYLSRVTVDGKSYPGISNLGVKPTVTDDNQLLIESYLFGYSGDAYGKEVSVELLVYRRPEQKFASVEEMKACVDGDIAYAKGFFGIE